MPPKKRLQYSEDAMDAAVDAVVKKSKSLGKAAREHGVPKTSLRNRLKGIPPLRKKSRIAISAVNENRLISWLQESAKRGFDKTKNQLLTTVQSVMEPSESTFRNKKPGRKWLQRFFKQHYQSLSTRTPQALQASVTDHKILSWFENARLDIEQEDPYLLKCPERIYNYDETSFQLIGGISKVIAPKANKKNYQITNDTRKQLTVLACGSASGDIQLPLIIFPGQRFHFDPLAGFPEAHFAKSSNGRINSKIFEIWFEQVFIPAVEHLQKPVLLFTDGHKTHLSIEVYDLCKKHGIILYQLPSYMIQPFDLTKLNKLKQSWRDEVMRYQEESANTLGKKDFAKVFKKAWEGGMDKDNVISGFREAGISPWNPGHVDLSKTMPSKFTVPPSTSAPALSSDSPSVLEVFASPSPLISAPALAPLHTSSSASTLSALVALDRLLDLSAKTGVDKLIRYRAIYDLQEQTNDPEERQFCKLYRQVTDLILSSTDHRDVENMKSLDEEKEREENQKRMLKEKERKQEKKEMKKSEKERKAAEKKSTEDKEKKQQGPRRQSERDKCTSDIEREEEEIIIDNQNANVCSGCLGEKDSMFEDWVACGKCGRWSHVECTNDESLVGKSVNEIENLPFICHECQLDIQM